jgi:hypothetical protein
MEWECNMMLCSTWMVDATSDDSKLKFSKRMNDKQNLIIKSMWYPGKQFLL